MKKLILILLLSCVLVFGAWDNDKPADSRTWNLAAGDIRANNDGLEVELGIDLNEAHPYFQSAAPTKKPDTTTDLDVDDNGRLWTDSDDNQLYVLTDFSGPTWTLVSATTSITKSDPTFTLQNTDEEDSDGGRQSRFIGKGEQSGSEVTTLGFTEFSHDGTSDDEKGKWRVVLNSGSEGNSPTNVPIEYTADGKIKVSTSLSVLDEDDLVSDGDKVLATQQSIKKYVDDNIGSANWTPTSYAGEGSVTYPNGMIDKMGLSASITAGATLDITFSDTSAAFPTACSFAYGTYANSTTTKNGICIITILSNTQIRIKNSTNATQVVQWFARGY